MHFFRSEEHALRWCEERGYDPGAILDIPTSWRLTVEWFGGRLGPDAPPRTEDDVDSLLEGLGLTDAYWRRGE